MMLYAANSTLITGFIQIGLVAQGIMVEISTAGQELLRLLAADYPPGTMPFAMIVSLALKSKFQEFLLELTRRNQMKTKKIALEFNPASFLIKT
ncbi:MAG: hypothetical protein WCI51_21105 [Lentisphaerota bacterium]